jgi:hypothetical protein
MSSEKKRQIKKEKIIKTLEEAKYSVIEWYIDTSNIVYAFLVRNDINNIDFLCYLPENILMTSDIGQYCYPTESPDFDMAKNLWNEISLDHLAVKVYGGLLLKYDKEWDSFIVSQDKKSGTEIENIASNFIGLDETSVVVSTKPAVEIVEDKPNPFDMLLDGVDYKPSGVNSRVEDSQPSILVNYKGFTYGQAIPLVNIMSFMNDLKGFEVKLAKMNKDILQYQASKIRTAGTEAVQLLGKFKENLEKSLKDWESEWTSSTELLSRVQSILEKSQGTKTINDIQTKAGIALKETTEQIISKRDSLLALLTTCKEVFHQV